MRRVRKTHVSGCTREPTSCFGCVQVVCADTSLLGRDKSPCFREVVISSNCNAPIVGHRCTRQGNRTSRFKVEQRLTASRKAMASPVVSAKSSSIGRHVRKSTAATVRYSYFLLPLPSSHPTNVVLQPTTRPSDQRLVSGLSPDLSGLSAHVPATSQKIQTTPFETYPRGDPQAYLEYMHLAHVFSAPRRFVSAVRSTFEECYNVVPHGTTHPHGRSHLHHARGGGHHDVSARSRPVGRSK